MGETVCDGLKDVTLVGNTADERYAEQVRNCACGVVLHGGAAAFPLRAVQQHLQAASRGGREEDSVGRL